MDQSLKIRAKTIKLLSDHIGVNLNNFGLGDTFLDIKLKEKNSR